MREVPKLTGQLKYASWVLPRSPPLFQIDPFGSYRNLGSPAPQFDKNRQARINQQRGPDVWEYRWRERGADGKRKHHRMVAGSVKQFRDKESVIRATTALRRDINMAEIRGKGKPFTLSRLADHYSQRELAPNNRWKTHSPKLGCRGYLGKWIVPRWGSYTLTCIPAGEIELWLRSLPLARSTCAKIRNVMSVLFHHGLRHELLDRNPVQWVRQSAKRKQIPAVLEIEEVQSLLSALDARERTMVLLDVVTGLRAGELFGLKWTNINFNKNEISVTFDRHATRRTVQNGSVTQASSTLSAPCEHSPQPPHPVPNIPLENGHDVGLKPGITACGTGPGNRRRISSGCDHLECINKGHADPRYPACGAIRRVPYPRIDSNQFAGAFRCLGSESLEGAPFRPPMSWRALARFAAMPRASSGALVMT